MLKLILFAVGLFIGYLIADSVSGLDSIRATVRQAIAQGRAKALQLISSYNSHPLVPVGIVLVVFFLLLAFLGRPAALLFGLVLGAVYKEEIGRLPFLSGIAKHLRSKISGPK